MKVVYLLKRLSFITLQFIVLIYSTTCRPVFQDYDENHVLWLDINDFDRVAADTMLYNVDEAQNLIVFIGDGLGPETITAARIYGKSEDNYLFFERFPFVGKLKTYVADKYVPHCASTPIFCGSKGNDRTAGVDSDVPFDDCEASLAKRSRLVSLFTLAQKEGKDTGFVTNARVTSETVASLYAHVANTNWECDAFMPNKSNMCKDIARQLIEDVPGKNIKVIMGGGMQCLRSDASGSFDDPIDKKACYSVDGRDLIRDWSLDKEKRHVNHAVVTNTWELQKLSHIDYLLGIFSNSNINYEHQRDTSPYGMPSLSVMAEKALEILASNPNGFFLVVEGGLIDHAHHEGHAKIALEEAVAFNAAVERIVSVLEDTQKLRDTLVIVTADHASSMVINGYPLRHSSLLGLSQPAGVDNTNYTTLTYATGGPHNYQFYADNSTGNLSVLLNPMFNRTYLIAENKTVHCPEQKILRVDPSKQDTEDYTYYQQAGILTDEVTHSGTDVNVYAIGPMAHLIHGTHEQTYLYYFIGFATNVGPIKKVTDYLDSIF